jgi:hypothetical protein
MTQLAVTDKELSSEARATLQTAFQDGYIVILNIGKKSWSTTLTPEMMGLKKFPDNWKPGRCVLLPAEHLSKIDHLEGVARRYLEKQSLTFGKQSRTNFRFVRDEMIVETLIHLKELKTDYFGALEALIKARPSLQEKMKTDFPDQWNLLKGFYDIGDDFIRNQYYFNYASYEMTFPRNMEAKNLEKLLRRQKLEGRVTAEYRSKAEEVLKEESEKAKQTAQTFIDDTFRAIRGHAVKAFQEIGLSIQTGKDINKKHVDKIRGAIDYVRKMDFLGDAEFNQHMSSVEKMLDGTVSFKDNAQAVQELDKILKKTVDFVNKTIDSSASSMTSSYFARNLEL